MLEKPFPLSLKLFTQGNSPELFRRVKHSFRKHKNPNNALTVTASQFKSYYKFSFVRNPWARAYSWFNNVIRDQVQQSHLGVTSEIDFKTFLKKFGGTGMLKPQTYWLKSFNGELGVDFVGRFEHLKEDFQAVMGALGNQKLELPHQIKGKGRDFRSVYDDETIELVARTYADEIKLFDYKFE